MNHSVAVGAEGYEVCRRIDNSVRGDAGNRLDVMDLYQSDADSAVLDTKIQSACLTECAVNLDARGAVQRTPLVAIHFDARYGALCLANALVLDRQECQRQAEHSASPCGRQPLHLLRVLMVNDDRPSLQAERK